MNAVTGYLKIVLRLEGLFLLIATVSLYRHLGFGWPVFFWCFLLPDLAFLGYLAGPRVGAICYNTTHSTIGAIAIGLYGLGGANALAQMAGLIWLAHIGFDRAMGYGLKYAEGFGFTHLGRVGREAR
jgi:hypothetical protein